MIAQVLKTGAGRRLQREWFLAKRCSLKRRLTCSGQEDEHDHRQGVHVSH